jgi:hypothetical protein
MPKPKKPKVHTQGYWKRKIDPEFSRLIRSKNFCEKCGRKGEMRDFDDAHVIGRKNLTLRWDILNHLCLCFQCHKFFWHEEPLDASGWFQEKFPERYKYLQLAKNVILKRTENDYFELLEDVQNRNFNKLVLPRHLIR